MRRSRTTEILSDTALLILKTVPGKWTGNFFVDEEVLKGQGITDFSKYKNDPNLKEEDLVADFFV